MAKKIQIDSRVVAEAYVAAIRAKGLKYAVPDHDPKGYAFVVGYLTSAISGIADRHPKVAQELAGALACMSQQ